MPATVVKLLTYLRALCSWLGMQAGLAWVAFLPILMVVTSWVMFNGEVVVRVSGVMLELLGVGITAFGLETTRKNFGKPALLTLVKRWWALRPKWPQPRVAYVSSSTAGGAATGSVRVWAWTTINPRDPIETQIAALNENAERMRRDLIAIDAKQTQLGNRVDQRFQEVFQAHAQTESSLRQKLESALTDGLMISFIGLIWVVLGVLVATMSPEISCLLAAGHLPGPSGCASGLQE
jgi:hypothetical protein